MKAQDFQVRTVTNQLILQLSDVCNFAQNRKTLMTGVVGVWNRRLGAIICAKMSVFFIAGCTKSHWNLNV